MSDRPFVHRSPNAIELERLRLLLSTYQDGTGQIRAKGRTLPGWRDFERCCALAFGGTAVESKFFVDVIFPLDGTSFFGLDCKMRRELSLFDRQARIYVEVTNASRQLWSHLNSQGITEATLAQHSQQAGHGLLEAIATMKLEGSTAFPDGIIDLESSSYLVLLWNRDEAYQLFQLPLHLPSPPTLDWKLHVRARRDGTTATRLVGATPEGVLYEWYGGSGGQFKYYPPASDALWMSERFRLETLTENVDHGIVAKAWTYFPEKWSAVAKV